MPVNKLVVIVIDRVFYEAGQECLVLRGHVKDADEGRNVFDHIGVGDADLGCFFPSSFHAATIAVDQMPLRRDTSVAANVVEKSIDVCSIRVQVGEAAGNVLAGQGDIP